MDRSTSRKSALLNQLDPFASADMSHHHHHRRIVGAPKTKGEYVWQIFPYLLTVFVIFAGFFASTRWGAKYWSQGEDVNIFGVRLGNRFAQPSSSIPWTLFKSVQLNMADIKESRNYQSDGESSAGTTPLGHIRTVYEKVKAVCRKWMSRRSKSEDSYTIINLLGIVEVRRKNSAAANFESKDKKTSPPKLQKSCAPVDNYVVSVLKRWDDILKLMLMI